MPSQTRGDSTQTASQRPQLQVQARSCKLALETSGMQNDDAEASSCHRTMIV
jgi:hypothetical protein